MKKILSIILMVILVASVWAAEEKTKTEIQKAKIVVRGGHLEFYDNKGKEVKKISLETKIKTKKVKF